jgi:phenylpyruvate tautomerase PptA (4-oxalocrotonate tautomerase family)
VPAADRLVEHVVEHLVEHLGTNRSHVHPGWSPTGP